jgi:S1-C subfamily serine protease
LAAQLKAPNTRGVLVYEMDTRSAAYREGLRPGDIIVRFDTTQIDDIAQFFRVLSDAKIGSNVKLSLLRDGQTISISVPIVQASGARSRRR